MSTLSVSLTEDFPFFFCWTPSLREGSEDPNDGDRPLRGGGSPLTGKNCRWGFQTSHSDKQDYIESGFNSGSLPCVTFMA